MANYRKNVVVTSPEVQWNAKWLATWLAVTFFVPEFVSPRGLFMLHRIPTIGMSPVWLPLFCTLLCTIPAAAVDYPVCERTDLRTKHFSIAWTGTIFAKIFGFYFSYLVLIIYFYLIIFID